MKKDFLLPRGSHLFLKHEGRSRTGMSTTVTVLVRDPEAQPGKQMVNISLMTSQALNDQRWHSSQDAMILQRVPHEREALGKYIAQGLGKSLHKDANAFTWEWL